MSEVLRTEVFETDRMRIAREVTLLMRQKYGDLKEPYRSDIFNIAVDTQMMNDEQVTRRAMRLDKYAETKKDFSLADRFVVEGLHISGKSLLAFRDEKIDQLIRLGHDPDIIMVTAQNYLRRTIARGRVATAARYNGTNRFEVTNSLMFKYGVDLMNSVITDIKPREL